MHRCTTQSAGQIIGQVAGLQVIGLDIAKSVFQLHTVDMSTGEIVNVQLKRAKVLGHFANRAPCLIGIEACGGAHHWARELTAQGHAVQLIHAKAVRPFVNGNKTDATDARAPYGLRSSSRAPNSWASRHFNAASHAHPASSA